LPSAKKILKPAIPAVHPEALSETTVKLTVNGKESNVQVEPNTTLRDVLRRKLGLTSVKDMCGGHGACGSCTVIMNGRPVLSCTLLAAECNDAVIETAEGIADTKHPLVEAYIMNWTAQCGYCTPGFIVTAKALLDRNTNPTIEEIKDALGGNICRCGNYIVHIKAIQEAAQKLRERK
jgi:aerobic-type carbon monoxide dehydrogenase small subunit (CoxS/CutS family)